MRLPFFIISAIATFALVAQNSHESDFYRLLHNKNQKEAIKVLKVWTDECPDDPELPIAWFNYHVDKARKISLSKPDKAGKRRATQQWDKNELAKAHDFIDKGIEHDPSRFDYYSTKAEIQFISEDYTGVGNTLARMFDTGKKIGYRWHIDHGTPVSDSVNATITAVEPFLRRLFDAHTKESVDALHEVCEAAATDFSDNPIAVHAAGKAALALRNPGKALQNFRQAIKLNGETPEYLLDVAYTCFLMDQDSLAAAYYKQVLKMKESSTDELNRAYYMTRMMDEGPKKLSLKQFQFTTLPWMAWHFAPGTSEEFLSDAQFMLEKYMPKMGYELDFDTKDIKAETVNIGGQVCIGWTFPMPKELGMMCYLVMVPNGKRYDVFSMVRYDRERLLGDTYQHRDYWEVYYIREDGMTAYARIPRPQHVATFAKDIVCGVLR